MREIKFRGKTENGIWIYGKYVDKYIVDEVIEATDEYIVLGRWCPVDESTVGQYTGLKDKNGVEIYEGDIVKTQEGDVQEVKWANQELRFGVFVAFICYSKKPPHAMGLAKTDEVIGNIHDNPELYRR